MESMQLEEIMEAVQGTLVQGVHSNIRITGVSIDSRVVIILEESQTTPA